jgi:hypothetical protein
LTVVVAQNATRGIIVTGVVAPEQATRKLIKIETILASQIRTIANLAYICLTIIVTRGIHNPAGGCHKITVGTLQGACVEAKILTGPSPQVRAVTHFAGLRLVVVIANHTACCIIITPGIALKHTSGKIVKTGAGFASQIRAITCLTKLSPAIMVTGNIAQDATRGNKVAASTTQNTAVETKVIAGLSLQVPAITCLSNLSYIIIITQDTAGGDELTPPGTIQHSTSKVVKIGAPLDSQVPAVTSLANVGKVIIVAGIVRAAREVVLALAAAENSAGKTKVNTALPSQIFAITGFTKLGTIVQITYDTGASVKIAERTAPQDAASEIVKTQASLSLQIRAITGLTNLSPAIMVARHIRERTARGDKLTTAWTGKRPCIEAKISARFACQGLSVTRLTCLENTVVVTQANTARISHKLAVPAR